jgi:hypothetical protein
MRRILIALLVLGSFTTFAADAVTNASSGKAAPKAGKVVKVLPLFLDLQGHDAKSPSLFDRDAYQVYLREHTNEISAVRFDVLWRAKKAADAKLKIRVELRGIGEAGVPRFKTLEADVTAGTFGKWTELTLGGDDYRNFGTVMAWRATLFNGDQLLGEQKSFLW